jgi:hypothetical protein
MHSTPHARHPCPYPIPSTQPNPRTLLHAAPAGAAPASDGDDDDDIAAGEQRHLEAEEGELDDIDMLIKQRKRRRGPDDQQITQMVTSMVARMEFAAEEDTKAQSNGAWRCLLPGLADSSTEGSAGARLAVHEQAAAAGSCCSCPVNGTRHVCCY